MGGSLRRALPLEGTWGPVPTQKYLPLFFFRTPPNLLPPTNHTFYYYTVKTDENFVKPITNCS